MFVGIRSRHNIRDNETCSKLGSKNLWNHFKRRVKEWVLEISIFLTLDSKSGCANAHTSALCSSAPQKRKFFLLIKPPKSNVSCKKCSNFIVFNQKWSWVFSPWPLKKWRHFTTLGLWLHFGHQMLISKA